MYKFSQWQPSAYGCARFLCAYNKYPILRYTQKSIHYLHYDWHFAMFDVAAIHWMNWQTIYTTSPFWPHFLATVQSLVNQNHDVYHQFQQKAEFQLTSYQKAMIILTPFDNDNKIKINKHASVIDKGSRAALPLCPNCKLKGTKLSPNLSQWQGFSSSTARLNCECLSATSTLLEFCEMKAA